MTCKTCGNSIPDNLLACRNCAEVASAMQESQTTERYEQVAYDCILRGVVKLWVQDCTCAGGPKIQHLAFALWCDFMSVSFCGHDISIGKCSGSGSSVTWKAEYEHDPEICLLCLDRLLHRGMGICAQVCSLCGGVDGRHKAKCEFKPLENKEVVARLGGIPSNERVKDV